MEELREMMRSLLQLQAAGEQQFARVQEWESMMEEERRQDGRLAKGSTGINSAVGASKILAENRKLMREQTEEMRLVEEAKPIMERQLLEELERQRQRQRQAELTAQKARKEKEKSKLERAAARKPEKVNSSLQRHLHRSTQEKEERQRELISMKGQIATLMQRQQFRADPAQLERKNRIAKRKKGKLPSDFTHPPPPP
ncbi:arginine and glutamate-rich protein 1-B-like [Gymnodraco acuticeps]|uniref:Arginine and glutamate-rich protein 1-B-like n=1 Tax=Gymnodraco acuticeps TaxID=8218 RepID=A0A6P8UBL3_GYMAC|nr:arginine and glutamate-rich protein 1-B-like [Gymnodraco acuticeps]